jgi:hypothetical protein
VNKWNMERWIEALRSGEFPQTFGSMVRQFSGSRNPNYRRHYCAVGVAWSLSGYSCGNWLGVSRQFLEDVIRMNDFDRCNFNEIADYLEARLREQEELERRTR